MANNIENHTGPLEPPMDNLENYMEEGNIEPPADNMEEGIIELPADNMEEGNMGA